MAEGSRTLKLSILADVDNLKKGLTTASTETDGFGTKLGDFSKKAGLAFAAAGAAAAIYAGKLLIDGVKAAVEDEKANALLAVTLKNVGGATDEVIKSTLAYTTATELATGVTEDELRPSLNRLTIATGDVDKAIKLQTLALDVSAGSGKSLEAVTTALAKAQEGNTASLGRLGIGLSAAELKTMSMEEVTDSLAKTFEGASATAADTFEGKMTRLGLAFEDVRDTVGAFVLESITPLVLLFSEKVVPIMSTLGTEIGTKLEPVFKDISDFVKDSVIPVFIDLWDYFTKNVLPLFTSYASLLSVTLLPAIKALWGFIGDFLVPIFKATLTPVITGLNTVFKKLGDFVKDNNAVFTFFGAVIGVIGTAAKFLAPIIGNTLGLAFKGVSLVIDAVSLAISGVVAAINLAIDAVNLLIKGYNIVNNLKPGSKDLSLIPQINLSGGAKSASVTPKTAAAVKDQIAKEVGNVAKQVAKETATITKTAAKTSAATASKVATKELKDGLGGKTSKIDQAVGSLPLMVPDGLEDFVITRPNEARFTPPPVINVNVSGAIDQEGTARTIVNTLNNSFYRGTNGANALAFQ
jgi:hypothetical protein